MKKTFFQGGENLYNLGTTYGSRDSIAEMYDKYTPSDLPLIF